MSINQGDNGETTRSEWERLSPSPSDEDLGYPSRCERGHIGVIEITETGETVIYDKESPDAWVQSSLAVDVDRTEREEQTDDQ